MKRVHNMNELQFSINPTLGGSGDLVSRLIIWIKRVTVRILGVINLLTKPP